MRKNEDKFMAYSNKDTRDGVRRELMNYAGIIREASKRCDLKTCSVACRMLSEAIDDAQRTDNMSKLVFTDNFGVLNHIFESVLPTLFKKDKGVIRKAVSMIKEDKNLIGEFNFYNSLNKIPSVAKDDDEARKILESVIQASNLSIDRDSIKASNKKFSEFLFENSVIPDSSIEPRVLKMYESADKLLTSRKTAANAVNEVTWKNDVMDYLSKSREGLKENKSVDIDKLIDEFDTKLSNNLTESEASIVKDIIDFKNPLAESRKRKLFDMIKEDCLNRLNALIKETPDDQNLLNTKMKVEAKIYNSESIVKDIANLMEIRDILADGVS